MNEALRMACVLLRDTLLERVEDDDASELFEADKDTLSDVDRLELSTTVGDRVMEARADAVGNKDLLLDATFVILTRRFEALVECEKSCE